jgi:hypothetical protein
VAISRLWPPKMAASWWLTWRAANQWSHAAEKERVGRVLLGLLGYGSYSLSQLFQPRLLVHLQPISGRDPTAFLCKVCEKVEGPRGFATWPGDLGCVLFAIWGETVSSIQGQTLNPYDLTRTPGGSSGGTGAGVAANFAIAGIGTDTVNSIRSPASANSIVGIRPTLGLVSRAGIIPYSFTQDAAGPLARTVTDAAKMLNVLVGYDPNDPARHGASGIPRRTTRNS